MPTNSASASLSAGRFRFLLGTCALGLLLPASSAYAADAAAPADATAADIDSAGGAGEILVSARRREEKIQDVPVAINAYSGKTLESTRTYNLRDLQRLTPSLTVTVTNPRNTSINIRGLGNNVSVYNDGLEPAVGVYQDGVYLARPGQAVFDMADLDHIEVLRGPQGTLFGKNTSAGAVVINTKAPSFNFEAGGDATYGNYDFKQIHAFINAPLIADKLAARVFVSKTDRDGYTTNRYDGSDGQDYHDFSVRGQLLFTPSSNLKVRVIGDYGAQHANTASGVLVGVARTYASGDNWTNNFDDRAAALGYQKVTASYKDRIVDYDNKQNYRMNQHGVSATADYSLDNATITSVTAYRAWNWYPHNDADSTSLDVVRDSHQSNNQKQFSQELRIASTGQHDIDYVAGVYYLYQKIDAEAVALYGSQAGAWNRGTNDATAADLALNGYSVISHSSPVTNSYAAFAQTVWHATPTLDLTTGLRYTYEKKTGWFDQTASGQSLSSLSGDPLTQANTLRKRFGLANSYDASTSAGRVSGQVTLSWKITPDILTYATYSRGNKFGGLNLSNINTASVNPVIKPETINSYEAGVKTSWLGGKLVANLTGFWTDDNDFQTTIVDTTLNNLSYFTNVGKVRSRGIEADVQAAPASWLSLYASGTFNDAKYVSYDNSPCPTEASASASTSICDMSGKRLPGVSKWAGSIGGEAHADVGENFGHQSEVYFGSDYSYRSNFYTTANDSIYSLIPSYGLVNLRFGIRATDGKYDVQFWARNVGDKDYFLTKSIDNTGAIRGSLGDPRTYGVTLRTKL